MSIFIRYGQAYSYEAMQKLLALGAVKDKDSLEILVIDSCSMIMVLDEPSECWYEDPLKQGWKDFIQNPVRPGRQINKQKAPKQSFKAQMRSVNRNR